MSRISRSSSWSSFLLPVSSSAPPLSSSTSSCGSRAFSLGYPFQRGTRELPRGTSTVRCKNRVVDAARDRYAKETLLSSPSPSLPLSLSRSIFTETELTEKSWLMISRLNARRATGNSFTVIPSRGWFLRGGFKGDNSTAGRSASKSFEELRSKFGSSARKVNVSTFTGEGGEVGGRDRRNARLRVPHGGPSPCYHPSLASQSSLRAFERVAERTEIERTVVGVLAFNLGNL